MSGHQWPYPAPASPPEGCSRPCRPCLVARLVKAVQLLRVHVQQVTRAGALAGAHHGAPGQVDALGNALIGQALVAPQSHRPLDLCWGSCVHGCGAAGNCDRPARQHLLGPIRSIYRTKWARPLGVNEAFLCMLIRGGLKGFGRCQNLHPPSPRANNPLESHVNGRLSAQAALRVNTRFQN